MTSVASRTLGYLASGQMSSDVSGGVSKTYSYDAEGRMIAAYEGGVLQASYDYDADGRQVSKTEGGATIHDPYDRLIAEHDGATGAVLREYIYLGLMPVAMIDHSTVTPTIYYIHTDQVMQPQKMTDATGAVVWDRVTTPFGVEVMATGSLTQTLRFPGQLEDSETSLFQNWNRDYDPLLGRYVQSDPIGLLGGINTYAYVAGNPLSAVDPDGLNPLAAGRAAYAAGTAAGTGAALLYLNRDEIAEDFKELFSSLAKPVNDNAPRGFCTLAREFPPVDSCSNRICQYQCRDGYKFTKEQAGKHFTCVKTAMDPRGY